MAKDIKKDRVVKLENKPVIHKWAGLEPSPESIKIHEKAFFSNAIYLMMEI